MGLGVGGCGAHMLAGRQEPTQRCVGICFCVTAFRHFPTVPRTHIGAPMGQASERHHICTVPASHRKGGGSERVRAEHNDSSKRCTGCHVVRCSARTALPESTARADWRRSARTPGKRALCSAYGSSCDAVRHRTCRHSEGRSDEPSPCPREKVILCQCSGVASQQQQCTPS